MHQRTGTFIVPKIVGAILVSAAGLVLSACQYTETGKSCSAGVGLRSAVYTGKNLGGNQLALTFDGPPGAAMTAMGDYLFVNHLQGAFFVDGASIAAGGKGVALATLKSEAHLVGNRGFTAIPLAEVRDPEREVRKTDALILPFVTGDMFLLRSSGASLSEDAAARLNTAGLTRYVGPIGWDIGERSATLISDEDCWTLNMSAADCANGYLTAIRAQTHGIVRLHAVDMRSAELLRLIVPQLKTEAYSFVRLDSVPEIQDALTQSGGKPGTLGGDPGCSEY